MFEIIESMLIIFIKMLPCLIAIYILFDFIGSLLFGKR